MCSIDFCTTLSSAKSDLKIVLKGIQKFVKILFIRKNVIFPCVSAKFLLPLHAKCENVCWYTCFINKYRNNK